MDGAVEGWDVPEAWRDAAEQIRAHLCALRGGAPFLSSSDALTLVDWLERGVGVADIQRALERAALARRKRRSRIPLRLTHAKRHLGRPTQGVFSTGPVPRDAEGVFAPVVRAMAAVPGNGRARDALHASLLAVEGEPQALVAQALAAIRVFLDAEWTALGPEGQARHRAGAVTELGDLVDLVDEATCEALVEEAARDALRQGYPALSAASLWELVENDGL